MHFQYSLIAALQALQSTSALAVLNPNSLDEVSVLRRGEDATVPSASPGELLELQHTKFPDIVADISILPILEVAPGNVPSKRSEDLELVAGQEAIASAITKREALGNFQVMADTGNSYKVVLANGATIVLHAFYNLGTELFTFYWTQYGPSTLLTASFGFLDDNNGYSISVKPFPVNTRYTWKPVKLYDTLIVEG